MNSMWLCMAAAFVAVMLSCVYPAESAGLNVKDFGAKGDGQADDSDAIQKALDAANTPVAARQVQVYLASTPELLFPAGHYRVSKTLKTGAYTRLRGDGGKVMLEQTDAQLDLIEGNGYRSVFEGLAFMGGRTALKLSTGNADSSMPKIADCQFYGTLGPAVILEGPSTLLTIEDCLFMACEQVLVNQADMAVVQNCWMNTSVAMRDKAVIVNQGVLNLTDVLGVPSVNGSDQRWIDNYGVLRAVRVRFGGEGAGFTPVVNFAKFDCTYPVWPTSVTLEQCHVYALGNPNRKAAVYCEEIPNTIAITDCQGLIDMALVRVSEKTLEPGYFDGAQPAHLRYTFWGNVTDTTQTFPIPKNLIPYTTSLSPNIPTAQ